jgi:UDP-glucose 4-epimerase
MNEKVIVFGGSGFLGSHVADALSDAGYDVVIYDIKPSPYLRDDQEMVVGDILDEKKIMEVTRDAKYVYNFAAIADISEASEKPVDTIKYNVLGNTIVLDACVENKVERFIFASSFYVYSNKGSFYRVSKQASELIIEAYNEKYGLEYTILRYGSLYGPRADIRNGIYRYLYQAIKDGKINYYGTGEERREYIHVYEAAKLSVEVLKPEFANQFVILTGQQVLSGKELLTMIKEMLDNRVEINMLPGKESLHYTITPYTFSPKLAKKLVSNMFIDIGEGLVRVMEEIYEKLHSDYCKEIERRI